MISNTTSVKPSLSRLCDDEVRHIMTFLGDKETVSALYMTSKKFQNLVIGAHKIRIYCFSLLALIKEINRKISLVYIHAPALEGMPLSILIDDVSETGKKSRKYTYAEMSPDLRIPISLFRTYVSRIEETPNNLLSYLFTHIKEDVIDALSEISNKNMVLTKLPPPNLPSIVTIAESDEKIPQGFEIDDIFLRARKREVGLLSLQNTAAKFISFGPIKIDSDGFALTETGEFCLIHESYFEAKESLRLLCVEACISSSRYRDWFRGANLISPGLIICPEVSLWIPVEILIGKKEGDTLRFIYKDKDIHLRVCQKILSGLEKYPIELLLGEAIINSFESELYSKYVNKDMKLSLKERWIQTYLQIQNEKALDEFHSKDHAQQKLILNQIYTDIIRKKSLEDMAKERSFLEESELTFDVAFNSIDEDFCRSFKKSCNII